MYKRFLTTFAFATCLGLAIATPSYAQDDRDDDDDDERRGGYREQVDRRRQDYADRYNRWRDDNEKRYRGWRESPPREGDRSFDLPDAGLEPGQYTVRLPFGLGLRVDVRDPRPAPPADGAWADRSYVDVYQRGRELNAALRDLQIRLERAGHAQAATEAAAVIEASDSLVAAASGRGQANDVRARYAEFDQRWHVFHERYGQEAGWGPGLQNRLASIDQYDDELHGILQIAPASPYDRPTVAAIAHELAGATDHLAEDLQAASRQSLNFADLARRAQRVQRHAADFNETVRQNAAFTTVIDEYAEFDRAWHRFVEASRGDLGVEQHVRGVVRQIRQLDGQLHRELYVNSPTVGQGGLLLRLSESVSRSAEHLYDDLRLDLRDGRAPALVRSRNFLAAAGDFQQSLAERQAPDERERLYANLNERWGELAASVNDELRGERFQHSREIAGELQKDIDRLAEVWQARQGRPF